jgi:hypothetical protein
MESKPKVDYIHIVAGIIHIPYLIIKFFFSLHYKVCHARSLSTTGRWAEISCEAFIHFLQSKAICINIATFEYWHFAVRSKKNRRNVDL